MKSRYYLLFFCTAAVFFNCHAQFKHESLQLGFIAGNTKVDIFKYRYVPKTSTSEITFDNIQSQSFKLRGFHFAGEEINNKYYIYAGGNLKFHVKEDDKSSSEQNFLFIKSAGGWSLGKKSSFLIGAQYEYDRFEFVSGDSKYDGLASTGVDYNKEHYFYTSYFGGHQYGINLNLLLMPNESVCFRTTLFIDKIKMKGIPGNVKYQDLVYTGSAIRPEFSLYLYKGKEKNNGLKITYTLAKRRINCTKDSEKTYVPDNSSSTNLFNVSLLLRAFWVKKQ